MTSPIKKLNVPLYTVCVTDFRSRKKINPQNYAQVTAVKKIFKLKKRPVNNPLIVHYYDINKLKQDCDINDNFIKLFNKFSPGPITFILKLKKDSRNLSQKLFSICVQTLVWSPVEYLGL